MRTPLSPAQVRIVPADVERWDDVRRAVSPGCWCMLPRFAPREMPQGREAMLRELTEGVDPPGLLAYVDGELAGWLGFGPLELLPALRRSTTLTQVDDLPVWSVVCFRIQRRHQGRGLTRMLLSAALEYAEERGAPALQGYPVDVPAGARSHPTSSYPGIAAVFEQAGFERVSPTRSTSGGVPRVLVRRSLPR